MKLITKEILSKLPKLYATENLPKEKQVAQCKFFTPDSSWTWYAIEFDGSDTFFGLASDGQYPEYGYFNLSELQSIRGRFGLPVERDRHFSPTPVINLLA